MGAQRAERRAPGRCASRAPAGPSTGRWSTNHATLARVEALESRWKSSSTSTTSRCSASALTSRGSTTSSSGAARQRRERLAGEPRADAAERLDHVRPQHDRVVVALVERHPRHRPRRRLALPPRREQRRLAEAGGARDQAQPAPAALAEPLEQPLARDRLRRDERRMELGDQQDRRIGPAGCAFDIRAHRAEPKRLARRSAGRRDRRRAPWRRRRAQAPRGAAPPRSRPAPRASPRGWRDAAPRRGRRPTRSR